MRKNEDYDKHIYNALCKFPKEFNGYNGITFTFDPYENINDRYKEKIFRYSKKTSIKMCECLYFYLPLHQHSEIL